MATKTFTQLTAETALAAADEFPFWDASAAAARKVTLTNLFGAIPVAIVATSPAAGTSAATLNTASSPSAGPLVLQYDGNTQVRFMRSGTRAEAMYAAPFDNSTGVGTYIYLDRNSNGSTPAASFMRFTNSGGSVYRIWPDATGNWRSHTADPTNANDTAGTVIGTQTSWHELKENIALWDGAEALEAIRTLNLYSYQMIEDGQATTGGEKPTYKGLVIMDEDREADAWFGLGYGENQVPVLNDRNLFGYMLAAIRTGANIIGELQARLAVLEEAALPGV